MKFHPYSEVFPLLLEKELAELAEDIKAHGLREKIWTYDGQILDGRNRFLACQRAKVKPEFRKYAGKDPLSFVVSLNVQRRHLTVEQRGFAAHRIATLKKGGDPNASRDALTQDQAAEKLDVSRSTVQRVRKIVEKGSKALQQAAESGAVPLRKAASVLSLPKSEQLAAATAPREDAPEMPSDAEMAAEDDAIEREYAASIAKVMEADDKLAAAHAEIKRQAAEIANLKVSRDGFMNGKAEITRLLGKEQNKNERLIKENERLVRELARVKGCAA